MRLSVLAFAMLLVAGCATTTHQHDSTDLDDVRESLVEMRDAMDAWRDSVETAQSTAEEALQRAIEAQTC